MASAASGASGRRDTKVGLDDVVRRNPYSVLRWEESRQAYVLLYPEGAVRLNPPAAQILALCTGCKVRDIIAHLKDATAADPTDDVLQFLQVACERRWIRVEG